MSFLIACFALFILIGVGAFVLGAIAALIDIHFPSDEPDDAYDLILASMEHLQMEAWRAATELRQLDQPERLPQLTRPEGR